MKKEQYRASVDIICIGYFNTANAAKKALSRKVIIENGGKFACGWVDRIEDDGTTTSVWQRILAGGEIGWWCNE
jgi:hypothetical protein